MTRVTSRPFASHAYWRKQQIWYIFKTMRLTIYSDYTLRVLMYLALDPERLATIAEIADAYRISENHLTKVVHQLARAGLLVSVRGKNGGIRLAKPPESVRIGDVVRASEGDAPIVECLGPDGTCRIAPVCKLQGLLVDAFDALYDRLNEKTLADLMGPRKQMLVALARR